MTEDEKSLLNNFEARIRHLMFLHDELKRQHEQLKGLLKEREDALTKLQDDYKQLDSNYRYLKSGLAVSLQGGDIRETKLKLSKLVREVDKCIAMLTQS